MSESGAMTLTSTVYEVASKLQSFNDAVMKLNEDFQRHPTKISVRKVQKVYQELRSLEGHIENQIEMAKKKKQCCFYVRNIEHATAVVISMRFLAWSLLASGQIVNLAIGINNEENLVRPVLVFMSAIVGALFMEVIGPAIADIDDDKDKQRVLDELQDIKNRLSEAKQFHKFLNSYNKFKKNDQNNPEELKTLITECIERLDNTPELYKRNIPSRDHWISLMFQILPENHPVKQQIRELKYAANKIFKLEKSEELSRFDSISSGNSSASSPLTARIKPEISESESDDTSSGTSTSSNCTSKEYSDAVIKTKFTHPKRVRPRVESTSTSSNIEPEYSESGYFEESDGSEFSIGVDTLQLPSLKGKVKEMLRGLRSFRGEKFSIESLSSLQRGDEKDKPIDDFESSIQNEAKLIAKSLKQEYQKYWKSLEDNLNFRFDCLSLDDESFSRNCETAKTIEELQRRVLESSGKGEEELEIVIE